jgi:hypothetical protein
MVYKLIFFSRFHDSCDMTCLGHVRLIGRGLKKGGGEGGGHSRVQPAITFYILYTTLQPRPQLAKRARGLGLASGKFHSLTA